MLTVSHLGVAYAHQQILEDVTFTVGPQEILAVLGPSGVGKTTLINAICGQQAHTGTVTLAGQEIDPQRQQLALVPQDYGLLPWLTVAANVGLPLRLRHAAANQQVMAMLEALGLTPLAKRYPAALSGGQRQRVALARAFVAQPTLLLLDEAFSALDPVVKQTAYALFDKQWQATPAPTLVVTHDWEEALVLSDRLLVLAQGHPHLMKNALADLPRAQRVHAPAYPQVLADLREAVAAQWAK
ncbi:ABC transporter ATP-binding protein [Lacticaseibacillus baoqingensis]|uniref:ABC transporter ATP-binding protein n=1 Tax=Lacticaseibacillus baoqingensis TaxID=2486013 RepID=A0ABW4E9R5_9LACO|nr:ABC transporter ATP-binding protein [Lacticaseibacillus baoqingensis]